MLVDTLSYCSAASWAILVETWFTCKKLINIVASIASKVITYITKVSKFLSSFTLTNLYLSISSTYLAISIAFAEV